MQQIKIKYRKGEAVKFISHRDLMRVFERAIRRAGLPIAFSQGFNPHMKISWGPALKVGAASDNEFATLNFDNWIAPALMVEKLSRELPGGVEILEANLV